MINPKQVLDDFNNGVIVCHSTLVELAQYAYEMQQKWQTPTPHADLLEAPPMPEPVCLGGDEAFGDLALGYVDSQIQARDSIWAERVRVALGLGSKPEPCTDPAACNAQGCRNPLGRCEEAASTVDLSDELEQALKDAQTGQGSYGPNYDGAKLAESIRALLAKQAAQSPVVGRDAVPPEAWRVRFLCNAILENCVVEATKTDAKIVLDAYEAIDAALAAQTAAPKLKLFGYVVAQSTPMGTLYHWSRVMREKCDAEACAKQWQDGDKVDILPLYTKED